MSPSQHRPLLLLGDSGQLGRELAASLASRGLAHRLAARRPQPGTLEFDLGARTTIAGLLQAVSPSLVVNAAAYTAVDRAQADEANAMAVNARGPQALAVACKRAGIPLVHFSTDYVFHGVETRPWQENDPVAPLSVYGRSKAAGESAIRATGVTHLILRTSWLYTAGAHNFVTTMLRLFQRDEPVRVVNDQTGCPTWARSLAGAVVDLLARISPEALREASGTYHICAGGETTWYDFAVAIAQRARPAPKAPLHAIDTATFGAPAPRPAYSVLDCSKARSQLGIALPRWEQQLEAAMPEFNAQAGHAA